MIFFIKNTGKTSISFLSSLGRISIFMFLSIKWIIFPPYYFKCVDILVTNFHLPKSTLLMLVAAFAGYELLMKAYKEAVENEYRFYSYGDAMVIL